MSQDTDPIIRVRGMGEVTLTGDQAVFFFAYKDRELKITLNMSNYSPEKRAEAVEWARITKEAMSK